MGQRGEKHAHAAVECRDSTLIDPKEEQITPVSSVVAMSVHKVQEVTVDEALVSLNKVFAPWQAYVDVRTLPGLIIKDFKEEDHLLQRHH